MLIFLLCFLFSAMNGRAQDTISVFFSSGSATIEEQERREFIRQLEAINSGQADSLLFIGMADTIGSYNANFKLSKKRVSEAIKVYRKYYRNPAPIKAIALGELKEHIKMAESRRVEVVIYSKKAPLSETVNNPKEVSNLDSICYRIDYALLKKCFISEVKVRRQEMIQLTIEPSLFRTHQEGKTYYYALKDNNNQLIIKKVSWRLRLVGAKKWRKKRFVAYIPKSSFNNLKIFEKTELPCENCEQLLYPVTQIQEESTTLLVDYHAMYNMQVKYGLFAPKRNLKVRVPSVYINSSTPYYEGCKLENKMHWRLKRHYQHSRLRRTPFSIKNISKFQMVCKTDSLGSDCDKKIVLFPFIDRGYIGWALGIESGIWLQEKQYTPFAGLRVFKTSPSSLFSITLGINNQQRALGVLRYESIILEPALRNLNPIPTWDSFSTNMSITRYADIFLGSELNTLFDLSQIQINQNIHAGIRFHINSAKFFMFEPQIEYGFGWDYLNLSQGVFPTFRFRFVVPFLQL